MPLTSARFGGVPELEACAVDDAAHLVPGVASGDHVALVQEALIDLGISVGAGGADGGYGPDTAAGVTAYKAARGLVNGAGQIDPIVGKGTIATLDAEIAALDAVLPLHDSEEAAGPPSVDLGTVPEPAVNTLLGHLGLGSLIEVAADGTIESLLGTAGDPALAGLLRQLTADAIGVFGDDPGPSRAQLVASLPVVAATPGVVDFAAVQADVANAATILDALVPGIALIAQLAAQTGPPGTPARDLTKTQAIAEAAAAHQLGLIVMNPPPQFDAAGQVTFPLAPATISIGSAIGPVTFRQVNFADKTRTPGPNVVMPYDPVTGPLLALDPRSLVGLIRLTQFLNRDFGVTELHHAGISGSNDPQGDCHRQGRAVDFVGVRGVAAAIPYTLTVLNDWATKFVPNLANPAKPRLPGWPPGTRPLEFRLLSDPQADGFARNFFQSTYAFVAAEFQDRTAGPGQTTPASTIGADTRIMNPDHPTSEPLPSKHGREAHAGHLHFQIGPTGNQVP